MKIVLKIFMPLMILLAIFLWINRPVPKNVPVPDISTALPGNSTPAQNLPDISSSNPQSISDFQPPLARAAERVTKKPFGIHITPTTSPIQPEKFSGYHTGTDFEIFPEELNIDVPVKAICSGKLLLKKYASGYGGVVVQECQLNNSPITVVYGHLKLASIGAKINDTLNVGDALGILGANNSPETAGERKHLHLGIHKGSMINILGYVDLQSQLSAWINACLYVCF